MSRKREAVFMGLGILAGLALSGPAVQATTSITATLSSQPIYVDGQRISMTAYNIGGNNFVKLRDIGRAVGFGVTYDAATNSVHIDSIQPYREELPAASPGPTEKSVQAALAQLKQVYPTGTVYGAFYRPNDPFNWPFSNSVRTIPIPKQAVDLLILEHEKHPDNPYMFPSPKTGTMYDPDSFRHTHEKILAAAGIEYIRFHDLGHMFVALSLQNGVDVKTLSNTLGHYSAGFTLDTYTHATQRMKRAAADTIGSVIDQAM